MTQRSFSLAYLTYAPLLPPDAISLAAKLGYEYIGLRLIPAATGGEYAPLITNRTMLSETKLRMKDTGVRVFDMEIIRIGEDFQADAFKPFVETSAALDAKAILVVGDDPDEARLTASYASLCHAAAPFNLTANLEFMPWTKVKDCKTARRIVEAVQCPNAGILVDALHAARSTTSLADIASLPHCYMNYLQICDAPSKIPATKAELIHTARCARLLPGDGGIELKTMFATLPQDLPISIEIPNDLLKAQLGIEEWSRRAINRARDLFSTSQK
jgi:sugar phosphate isomerase/epimerase